MNSKVAFDNSQRNFHFNKGNVNYEFQLRKDYKDIKINFVIILPEYTYVRELQKDY